MSSSALRLMGLSLVLCTSCRANGDSNDFRIQRTRSRVDAVGDALGAFRTEMGRFPTDAEGLHILGQPGDGKEPFIRPGAPLVDAWNQPLVYHPAADGRFALYSVGPNGRDDGGGSDDIRFDSGRKGGTAGVRPRATDVERSIQSKGAKATLAEITAEALTASPRAVLEILEPSMSLDVLCENEDSVGTTLQQALRLIDARRAAVRTIHVDKLAEKRDKCLEMLETASTSAARPSAARRRSRRVARRRRSRPGSSRGSPRRRSTSRGDTRP